MPPPLPAVSRRALLGASVAAVGLGATGCSFDSLDPSSDDPTITPTGSPSTGTDGAPQDDEGQDGEQDDAALVADVLTALATAHRVVRGTRRAHRDLDRTLRPVETLHLTHAAELGDLPTATGRATRSGETSTEALSRVAGVETRLQATLVDAATAAGSGALAQTFASMAAAVAQARTTLAPPPPDETDDEVDR